MLKLLSSWRNELPIIAEIGIDTDNGKLNKKKREILEKYIVSNAREVVQLTENLKQKLQTKAQINSRHEITETQYRRNKIFKDETKNFT